MDFVVENYSVSVTLLCFEGKSLIGFCFELCLASMYQLCFVVLKSAKILKIGLIVDAKRRKVKMIKKLVNCRVDAFLTSMESLKPWIVWFDPKGKVFKFSVSKLLEKSQSKNILHEDQKVKQFLSNFTYFSKVNIRIRRIDFM